MTNFIILDRSKQNDISFVSNSFLISGFAIPQTSKNPRDAKKFDCKVKAQNFIDQFVPTIAQDFFIL